MIKNNFINDTHKEKLKQLLKKADCTENDSERYAFFYIMAGNDDLYSKIEHIYDFEKRLIKPYCLESGQVDFCSSSRKLIKLAFNLFNGYPADVLDTFYILDDDNFNLAINAIKIRFWRG